MNDNARAWVQALRYGGYEQTQSRLQDSTGFCCLGVACKLAVDCGLDLEVFTQADGSVEYDGERYSLPERVQEWLGITTGGDGGLVTGHYHAEGASYDTLADANDTGVSFDTIADLIELHDEQLFQ